MEAKSSQVYPCTYSNCNKVFRFSSGLDQHRLSHAGKRFNCDFCHKSYARRFSKVRHMKAAHSKELYSVEKVTNPALGEDSPESCKDPFICPCKYSAIDWASFVMHVQNNHPQDITRSSSMKRSRQDETNHTTEEETTTEAKRPRGDGDEDEAGKTASAKNLTCKYCGNRCSTQDRLIRHIQNRNTTGPYKCPYSFCHYKSCSQQIVSAHVTKMHLMSYDAIWQAGVFPLSQNPTAQKGFLSWSCGDKRYDATDGDQDNIVDTMANSLPAYFAPPASLDLDVSFSRTCLECKKTFTSSFEFEAHLNNRVTEAFNCRLCCYSCKYECNLTRHTKSHN